MLIKVKHEELKQVKDVMKKDGDLLDDEINVLLEQMEKLKTIWQGQDADVFYNHVYDYINKMKNIPNAMRHISEYINKANNRFADSDDAFSKQLQTEVEEVEPNNNNKF